MLPQVLYGIYPATVPGMLQKGTWLEDTVNCAQLFPPAFPACFHGRLRHTGVLVYSICCARTSMDGHPCELVRGILQFPSTEGNLTFQQQQTDEILVTNLHYTNITVAVAKTSDS